MSVQREGSRMEHLNESKAWWRTTLEATSKLLTGGGLLTRFGRLKSTCDTAATGMTDNDDYPGCKVTREAVCRKSSNTQIGLCSLVATR